MTSDGMHKGRWLVFALVVLAQFVLSFASYGWGPLAPFLKEKMAITNVELGFIASIFYLASAMSALPGGLIVDKFGVRRGMVLWLCITGAPLALIKYFSTDLLFFLGLVAISGAGYGMGNPVASKGLFLAFQRELRGTVFGIRQSAVTVGGALGGILIALAAQTVGPFVTLQFMSYGIILTAVGTILAFPSQVKYQKNGLGQNSKKHALEGSMRMLREEKALVIIDAEFWTTS